MVLALILITSLISVPSIVLFPGVFDLFLRRALSASPHLFIRPSPAPEFPSPNLDALIQSDISDFGFKM